MKVQSLRKPEGLPLFIKIAMCNLALRMYASISASSTSCACSLFSKFEVLFQLNLEQKFGSADAAIQQKERRHIQFLKRILGISADNSNQTQRKVGKISI